MSSGRYIAYYRVSTKRQGRSCLGLEAQKSAVTNYLNGGRWKLVAEVTEVESGKRSDRPELFKALALCRLHGAKLVVAKMDRLSRNVHFLSGLMESKVEFVACDMPQANNLTVHILAAVAEAEAEAISTRTKAALAAAKARGVKLGGDRGNIASVCRRGARVSAQSRRQRMLTRAADLKPIIDSLRASGAASSLREIAAVINERGIKTARGCEWSATQVLRVISALSDHR